VLHDISVGRVGLENDSLAGGSLLTKICIVSLKLERDGQSGVASTLSIVSDDFSRVVRIFTKICMEDDLVIVLDFGLDFVNSIRGIDVESDRLAGDNFC